MTPKHPVALMRPGVGAVERAFAPEPDAGWDDAATRIDQGVFALWMAAIGDRIGRRLDKATLAVYRRELGARFDTDGFVEAARAVFARPLYAQWPGPDEFLAAAGVEAVPYAVPGVEATRARLDAEAAVPRIDPAKMRQAIEDARLLAATLKHEGSLIVRPRGD